MLTYEFSGFVWIYEEIENFECFIRECFFSNLYFRVIHSILSFLGLACMGSTVCFHI